MGKIERFWFWVERRFNRHFTKYRPNWLYNWFGLIGRHKAMMAACRRITMKDPMKIQQVAIKCETALKREAEDRAARLRAHQNG